MARLQLKGISRSVALTLTTCSVFGCARAVRHERALHAAPPVGPHVFASFNSLILKQSVISTAVPGECNDTQRAERVLGDLAARGLRADDLLVDARVTAGIVLAMLPDVVPVYPSDYYFYFDVFVDNEHVGGNLRFSDAQDGIMHCGVYQRGGGHRVAYKPLGVDDGIEVCSIVGEEYDFCEVRDSATGAVRNFVLPHSPVSARVSLLPREQWIAAVLDESGFSFDLVFNHATCEFAYLLAASPPEGTSVDRGADDAVLYRPSNFAMWRDPFGRWHLTAVRGDEVSANTFYDGPFDQVPPKLELRQFLVQAYPGIESYENDVLDTHGNWTARENVRVAIAPYREAGDDVGELWVCSQYAGRWTTTNHIDETPLLVNAGEGPAPEAQVLDWRELQRRASRWSPLHEIPVSIRGQ